MKPILFAAIQGMSVPTGSMARYPRTTVREGAARLSDGRNRWSVEDETSADPIMQVIRQSFPGVVGQL